MNTWLCFFPLLLLILAAQRRSQRTLRLYFRAQLIYTPVAFFGYQALGNHHSIYAVLYASVTLLVLETCCFLIWEAGLDVKYIYACMCFGLLVGIIAAPGMVDREPGEYVTFFEGVILAAMGPALLLAADTSPHKRAVNIIGKLSVALSIFDFVYLLNMGWEPVNGWLPSVCCILAFAWIVLFASKEPDNPAGEANHRV